MQNVIYKRLAQKLDALPNRFPTMLSSLELLMLKKTAEKAGLVCIMRFEAE